MNEPMLYFVIGEFICVRSRVAWLKCMPCQAQKYRVIKLFT